MKRSALIVLAALALSACRSVPAPLPSNGTEVAESQTVVSSGAAAIVEGATQAVAETIVIEKLVTDPTVSILLAQHKTTVQRLEAEAVQHEKDVQKAKDDALTALANQAKAEKAYTDEYIAHEKTKSQLAKLALVSGFAAVVIAALLLLRMFASKLIP